MNRSRACGRYRKSMLDRAVNMVVIWLDGIIMANRNENSPAARVNRAWTEIAELDYQVTMISDVMWGHKQGQHEATLTTFFQNFGDVRLSDNVIEMISNNTKRSA